MWRGCLGVYFFFINLCHYLLLWLRAIYFALLPSTVHHVHSYWPVEIKNKLVCMTANRLKGDLMEKFIWIVKVKHVKQLCAHFCVCIFQTPMDFLSLCAFNVFIPYLLSWDDMVFFSSKLGHSGISWCLRVPKNASILLFCVCLHWVLLAL